MILSNLDHDYENDFISIDVSNETGQNRSLDIYGKFNPSTNEYEYTIQVHWMDEGNSVLKIDEKLFLDFAEMIQKSASKILNR